MSRVVLILAVVALTLYCLIECVQTDRRQVRYLPKALWLFLVLIPVVGPAAWLVGGRPRTPRRPPPGQRSATPRRPPVQPAPDDDPAFLARLEQQSRLAARDEEMARAERARREQAQRDQAQPDQAQREAAPARAPEDEAGGTESADRPEPPTPPATPAGAGGVGTDEAERAETDSDPESRRDSGS